jgi:hypothetical protein
MAFTSSERRFHAFEEPAPRLSGEKFDRGQKEKMRARVRTYVLGTACSRFYDFGFIEM